MQGFILLHQDAGTTITTLLGPPPQGVLGALASKVVELKGWCVDNQLASKHNNDLGKTFLERNKMNPEEVNEKFEELCADMKKMNMYW
jgi:hypothetical protein